MRRVPLLLLALAGALIAPASSHAVTLESVGSFSSAVFVTSDPADEDRLFVVEQGGTIKLRQGGVTSTFLDLTASDPDLLLSGGEQGLLSMALAPDFPSTGHFYVYYTRNGATSADDGDIQIDEFTASGNSASLATRRPVLTIDHESATNHNGGQLQLGPDGLLYVATGDGGGGNDPEDNAQDLDSLLGKILRIDPDQGTPGYTVPADNPYVGVAGADEIWSYGLRNPWRFSFDRLTGDLLIGDVGQGAWEEIDYGPTPNAGKGLNFGWDCREGPGAGASPSPECPPGGFTAPIHTYANDASTCAVTGGYVVRDPSLPTLVGRYLYADYCAGQIRSLDPDAATPSATDADTGLDASALSSFGEDACGRVYAVSQGGPVYRLIGDEPADCGTPPPPLRTLTVTVGGAGAGTVASSPSGISCPGDCIQSYAEGQAVTLTPAPTADSLFAGWSGACSGTGSCAMTMSANRAVTAAFDDAPPEPPPTCAGVPATIVAKTGRPVEGTPSLDVIVGTTDGDRIDSGGGDDLVCAGAGRDRVRAGGGQDIVKGNNAPDRLRGAGGADVLQGGAGKDHCNGGPGKDRERSC